MNSLASAKSFFVLFAVAAFLVLMVLMAVAALYLLWRIRKKQEAPAAGSRPDPAPAQAQGSDSRPDRSVAFAIEFVRENSAGANFRYRAPWFLLLGASGSGKSALLEHSGLSSSLPGSTTSFGMPRGIQWRFCDAGVVLDVPGNFFLRADDSPAEERKWQGLLRGLERHRPERPISGVVLTLACTDLVGEGALPAAALSSRGRRISDKLWQMQKCFGFSFPVYVVLTKCDAIPGFKDLARQLPAERHREMFGWSNPHHLDSVFDPAWVDQGFEQISRGLDHLRCEVLVERHDPSRADKIFLLPLALEELRTPLKTCLAEIFRHTSYREMLYFRGFYLAGDAAADSEAALPAAIPSGSDTDCDWPEVAAAAVPSLAPAAPAQASHSPVFVQDLFEQKIFPEHGLARPLPRARVSRNRQVLIAQGVSIVAAIVLLVGVWVRYNALSRLQQKALWRLDRIVDNGRSHDLNPPLEADGSDPAYDPIYVVETLAGRGFKSVFLPASIIHPLREATEQAMTPPFQAMVYNSMGTDLRKRVEQLLNPVSPYAVQQPKDPLGQTPLSLQPRSSFQALANFTGELLAVEDQIVLYNHIVQRGHGNAADLLRLTRFLNSRAMPEDLSSGHSSLDVVTRSAQGTRINPAQWANKPLQRMQAMLDGVLAEWLLQNPLLPELDQLAIRIDQLRNRQPQENEQLVQIRDSLAEVQSLLERPESGWMARGNFELPAALQEILTQVSSRPPEKNLLLCPERPQAACPNLQALQAELERRSSSDFQAFRRTLFSTRTALTGQLVEVANGRLQLSPPATALRLALESFLKTSLAEARHPAAVQDPGGERNLAWSKARLEEAIRSRAAYDNFRKDGLSGAPPDIQELLRQLALSRLEQKMLEAVAAAQEPRSAFSSGGSMEGLAGEVQNFQDAAPELATLLDEFHDLGLTQAHQQLLRTAGLQALNLLEKIDGAFEEQSPYSTGYLSFNLWTDESRPGRAAFGVHSPEEMQQYLALQAQQVQQFAAQAKPVVAFLEGRLPDMQSSSAHLLAKWQAIVGDWQKYSAKSPGNSLAVLEDFLGTELEKASPESCPATPNFRPILGTEDYFARKLQSLRQALAARCGVLAEENALHQYARIADLFNQHLAGRFPFARTGAPAREQADPQDVAQLYRLLDQNGAAMRKRLEMASLGRSRLQALRFLDQLQSLRPLFSSLLSDQGDAALALDFVPAFRVNREREVNGNQIAEWTLQTGKQVFHDRDPERALRWSFGEPVKLTLRWAKDAPVQPVAIQARSDAGAIVAQGAVIYEFRDPWALFTMMVLHQVDSAASEPVLAFTALTASKDQTMLPKRSAPQGNRPDGETRVFIAIRLRLPGKPANLRLPSFPVTAPAWDATQTAGMAGEKGDRP